MEKLALLGGDPLKTKPFPEWPQYDEHEQEALLEVLESGAWWRTPGSRTKAFEEAFAAYHDARYGIACTNGTAAIEIMISALGIGLGDEVIVPDFTFVATASAVLLHGALPVFVDVDRDTYCINPQKVKAAITERTRAIIAVHLAGHPADLDALQEIADQYGLHLLEDCAHAHGSEWKGKKVGAFGKAGTFSFQQSKLMTAGEGGILLTNDPELEILLRSVHDCGRMPGEWFYSHFINGGNYRLSEWQGAILNQHLSRFDSQARVRSANASFLNENLKMIEGITPQFYDPRVTRNGHYCYIFTYEPECFDGLPTQTFIQALEAEGIPTQASYPPLHALDVFTSGEYLKRLLPEHAAAQKPFRDEDFPVTEVGFRNTVWLLHRTLLGDEQDAQEIVDAVRKIQRQAKSIR
jgi:dTDP-4-amino-4,6-dideoxygalactose transaminase